MEQSVLNTNFVTFITGGHCRFWSINPYALCDYNCTYCITGVQGESSLSLGNLRASLATLEEALDHIQPEQPIVIGGISDAYPFVERDYGITRSIVERLRERGRKFTIITKSTLVARDVDLLHGFGGARVEFSFSTLDDAVAAQYELAAPAPSKRLAVLKEFWARGIAVKVSLRPWIPDVSHLYEFLAEVPAAIPIGLERLKVMRASKNIVIAGRLYSQSEIDRRYLEEREKYRCCLRLKWSFDERFTRSEGSDTHPVDIIVRENTRILSEHIRPTLMGKHSKG